MAASRGRSKPADTDTAEDESGVEQVERPEHLADLCGKCGADENGGGVPHPSSTSFACEHGAWRFPRGAVVDGDVDPRDVEIARLRAELDAARAEQKA